MKRLDFMNIPLFSFNILGEIFIIGSFWTTSFSDVYKSMSLDSYQEGMFFKVTKTGIHFSKYENENIPVKMSW